MIKTTYSDAILSGFDYLLKNYQEVFVLGQGLWSPWYVGNTMKNLDKKYGKERICLLYTSPSPRDYAASRMPSSA